MRFQQVYDWIEVNKPEVILEVGTWNGLNGKIMMREGAKKYIGFDIWEEGDETLDELENNAKKRVTEEDARKNLEGNWEVELIKGNTRATLTEYVKGKKPFVDMAVIDGGHSKGTIKKDLSNVLTIMKPTGVVFLDDFYFGCADFKIGAASALIDTNLPYTVLPHKEKTVGGYLVQIARIDMKDVPRYEWEEQENSWRFEPC